MAAAAVLIVAVVAQHAFLPWLPLPGPAPDLVLVAVAGLALAAGSGAGTLLGFLAGLALDLAPPANHPIGAWAMCMSLAGYVIGLAADATRRGVAAYLAVTVAAAVSPVAYALGAGALGSARTLVGEVPGLLVGQVVYALLLTPVVVPAMARLALGRSSGRLP
ncbi:rod shape-determining protein MreD [Jiangella rhizosphaerae]|uniref:Rod shape-determining protein MreD n=2 Tax=Jiangella rhizosphaerae TaxID=2293569 RepID=A0A418KNZ7_9ACTN|nr:rod shape-determining protein MreD [Jiangella rhizosphaerae]